MDEEKGNSTETTVVESSTVEKRKGKLYHFFFGWVKDNYDKTFLLVLLAAFIIRVWVFTKTYEQPIWWDGADYLAAAKRWAGTNPNLIDIWYYRRGFLWPLISTFFFFTGLGEIPLRFFIVLMSTGMVLVSYSLIAEMFNKKLALLASIGMTFSWVFLFFTGRILTDLPSAFFLVTALLFFWKGYVKKQGMIYFVLFGISYACAVLTRMQYLMFSLSFLFFAIINEKHRFVKNKGLWTSVIIFFIILIPQFFIHNSHFGNPILDLASYYLGFEGISQTGEVGVELAKVSDLFLYFTNMAYILDANNSGYTTLFAISPLYVLFVIGFFLFFIDLFLGMDRIFKDHEIQKRAFMLFFIVSTFIFLGYIAPHLEQRYVMQSFPFLMLITVYPSVWIESFLSRQFNISGKKVFGFLVIGFALLMIPNILFAQGLIDLKKTSYQEIKDAGEWIKEHSEPDDIIIGGSWPQLTYYSERSVYPNHLAYRRDLKKQDEEVLNKFVLEKRPRYYSISILEKELQWAYNYPAVHQDILTPVQVYQQNNQPILVIYEFHYENIISIDTHTFKSLSGTVESVNEAV